MSTDPDPRDRPSAMPRAVRVVLVGVCYLVFGGFGAVLAYVLLPLQLLGVRGEDARVAAAQALLHRWSRRYLRFMQALHVARPDYPALPEVLTRPGAVVVVANHPSLLDVVFMMAALPRITYVAKQSWIDSPLVGRLLRSCGHIAAPRGKTPADGAIALDRMIGALQADRALLVFPEGTRSPRHGLLPFQRGAFEAAVRAGVPLVPCVLDVDPPMLRKEQPWYDVADRTIAYRMRVLPTRMPAEVGSGRQLCASVREAIAAALGLAAESPADAAHEQVRA
ncbi:MAG: lysophospholipid acyltransferase family protein [Nannocystaceae bacterium]